MPDRRWRLSRRGFLVGAGVTGAGLALGVRLGLPFARLKIAETITVAEGPAGRVEDSPPTAWFEIDPDNTVRLFVPKSEMGQGIHTALAQIAAEELAIPWDALVVAHAPTSRALDGGVTGASNSVSTMYQPLREAAATMRQMLLAEGAALLNRSSDEVIAAEGRVFAAAAPEEGVTYGDIVARVESWTVPEAPPRLKGAGEFAQIGRPARRVDLPDKVTGQAVYGYDARLPNMLYGAVARPPRLNSRLRRAAPGDAPNRDGVVEVVVDDDFAGVAATSRAAAYTAVGGLDVEWSDGPLIQQADIEAATTAGNGTGVIVQKEGDTTGAFKAGGDVVLGEFRTPLAAHAHLEPQAALVDVTDARVRVWVATQAPFLVQTAVADALGRDAADVEVTPTYLGGGLGSKLGEGAAVEAARLSRAAGRPVHVGWNRTEDLRYGYFRPPTHHVLKATLADDGRIEALEHQQASGDVAFLFLPGFLAALMGADFGAWRGGTIPYAIPHRRTVAWRVPLPIRTGWWRGLGLLANVFAVECFVDDVAQVAGVDPLQFRLNQLPADRTGDRFRRVLETAAERAGWGRPLPAGRALGLAMCIDVNTVVATIAEVSVAGTRPRVHHVTTAIEPGLVINPDGVVAQTEGATMMALSSALFEEITVKDSMVEARNFDRYPLLTMTEAPTVDVIPISDGDRPFGVGEPPIGPVVAAVGNAVFALTGRRLRRLPFRLN